VVFTPVKLGVFTLDSGYRYVYVCNEINVLPVWVQGKMRVKH